MKIRALATAVLLATAAGPAIAQSGDMPSMSADLPEECRAILQTMPEQCRSAMKGMAGEGMTMQHGAMPEATNAYVAAMDKMHEPMMTGVMDPNPDAAFVRGMIPHHQGAIDMARVVQQYGQDQQTKSWAARIIEAQEGEIAEMREWLAKNAK